MRRSPADLPPSLSKREREAENFSFQKEWRGISGIMESIIITSKLYA
jgi:hypothetical protein